WLGKPAPSVPHFGFGEDDAPFSDYGGFGERRGSYTGGYGDRRSYSAGYGGSYGARSAGASRGGGKKTAPAAAGPAKTAAPLLKLDAGDMVNHKTFGNGMVLSVTPMGGDALIEVAFDKVGTKKLMLKTAGVHMTRL
ncbi:MAG: ATP-dependent DNA helicase PcrA, partial [Oscillospiraceae bacterium]|nr:ATP-dependent DNA helicase PcrA [Oscillospiraceae bacterium]